MTIRLVLADDHPLVLDGLLRLFETEVGFTVLAHCTDGEAALEAVRAQRPDVLVLDLRMPRMGGLDLLRALQSDEFKPRVVVLTAGVDDEAVLEAIRLGVKGVVLKEMAPRLLVQCIRTVHGGGRWLERDTVGRALEHMLDRETEARRFADQLTPRELEVVRLVAAGRRNKEIARELSITEGTVKIHIHNIYEKLSVNSRVELATRARDRGIV